MDSTAARMNRFLAGVEKRAYTMANLALANGDDAMDVVQDAMLALARRYARKPESEWAPLFFRIVQNGIRDCQRRRTRSGRLFTLFSSFRGDDGEALDPAELHAGRDSDRPDRRTELDGAGEELTAALGELPDRQRQAFLLRAWQGLSVQETARAMRCSDGSVKTHYSRAVHRLREVLGEHWS
jgi:RNA polymerase sigma-70 factor (ECF subfamily)